MYENVKIEASFRKEGIFKKESKIFVIIIVTGLI